MTQTINKERADIYRRMMESDGWKDLEAFALRERDQSMQRMDSTSASDLTIGQVCEERGIRKGIMKILQRAQQCREGV